MKYISYSLWGDNPLYTKGVLRNIEQSKNVYPSWKVVVYYDNTVPITIIQQLEQADAVVIDMTNQSYGMFWRFLAADLPDCEYAIFRDSDSRLSLREKLAVDEWIKSGKSIHIMRDHPYHKIPFGANQLSILGGMWGIKGRLFNMRERIDRFSERKVLGYGIDQTFLEEIFLQYCNDAKVHDELFSNAPFPIKREGFQFVGERIDENELPIGTDREVLTYYLHQRKPIQRIKSFARRCVKKIINSLLPFKTV